MPKSDICPNNLPVAGGNIPKRKNFLLPWIGRFIFAVFGWRLENEFPDIPKFLVVLGPHTSNWEFVFGIAAIFILRARISWMGKNTIFRKPFGGIVRWLGGIPINRSSSHGVVETMIHRFKTSDKLIIAIAPEGTRKKVDKWKTGFYHIAVGAGLPILMACFDYENKVIRFGPLIYPSGDMEADIKHMQSVFDSVKGKRQK